MGMILPKSDETGKPQFSYSQYTKWKRAKKDYIKSYMFGEKFEGNAYTDFGSLVGGALETNDFSVFEPHEVKTLMQVTRLDEFEKKVMYDLGECVLLGFIDTNDKKYTKVIDYKTGAMDKEEVYLDDDYNQVTIYAGAIEQETGILPKEGWVELIERHGNPFRGEDLTVGSNVVKIPQDVSKEAVEAAKKDLIKVAKEISAHYKVFLLLNEATV